MLLWDITKSDTVVRLTPTSLLVPIVGKQFILDVDITNGKGITACQLTVEFDDATLRHVSNSNGKYFTGEPTTVVPIGIIKRNRITLAASSVSGEGGNGGGTLVKLTFEVVAIKASTVVLSEVILSDTTRGNLRPHIEAASVPIVLQEKK